MSADRLGIGFVGSGFNARFHIQSLTAVREIDVRGVYSPNEKNAASSAALARELDVGEARPYKSIRDMVADPAINALWLCGPNHARISNIEEIVAAIKSGAGTLRGLACEKPLARNVAEAKKVADLARSVGLSTGYLENQLFSPDITRGRELVWARGASLTGRPYLARAAEEHSGPHMPWFWQGNLQGGGVLNDMMCHSVEVVRHLLTKPGDPRSSIKPVRINANIASLKWSRPKYAKLLAETMGKDVDYTKRPSEDFARATIEYEADSGETLIGEVTTSWSFIGAGLRLSAELLGPEYSMSWNTLDSSLKMFFSREVKGKSGEDLVEKQNAEMGLMPVVADEASV
ncbi:MAG TPA: Gfo/Idh/MocA family oxidoreductase, partial [Gemmatimonadaceae bacterium]|nr:Gfo/Idh/MocA family oxidoreductase [Gemmatimonadaceae bacterium]